MVTTLDRSSESFKSSTDSIIIITVIYYIIIIMMQLSVAVILIIKPHYTSPVGNFPLSVVGVRKRGSNTRM